MEPACRRKIAWAPRTQACWPTPALVRMGSGALGAANVRGGGDHGPDAGVGDAVG